MVNSQFSTVFFGSGVYTIPIIEMLAKHGLELVVTTEKDGPFISYLKKNNIKYLISNLKKAEDIEKIKNFHAPVAVLASYGAIIPQSVLAIFKHGILNIHPSLLPKHRGTSPIQASILNGDTTTGVSVIKLDNEVDHGPILAQEIVKLNGNETMKQLKQFLFKKGAEMVDKLLTQIRMEEPLRETEQDHKKATFTKKITREDGFVEIEKPPSQDILNRMIRAYHPWPGVWTQAMLFDKSKRIKIFPKGKIQVEGKHEMTYKEFVNGYQKDGKQVLEKLGLLHTIK